MLSREGFGFNRLFICHNPTHVLGFDTRHLKTATMCFWLCVDVNGKSIHDQALKSAFVWDQHCFRPNKWHLTCQEKILLLSQNRRQLYTEHRSQVFKICGFVIRIFTHINRLRNRTDHAKIAQSSQDLIFPPLWLSVSAGSQSVWPLPFLAVTRETVYNTYVHCLLQLQLDVGPTWLY